MDPNDDLWTAIRRSAARRRRVGGGRGGRARRSDRRCPPERLHRHHRDERAAGTRKPRPPRRSRRSWAGSSRPRGPGRQAVSSRSTRSPTCWSRRRRSRPRDRWTSRRSWRSSGLRERSRRGPTARSSALQHRYAVTRRLIWEHCVAAIEAGRLDPRLLATFGRFLLLWNELTSLAVTDGYRIAERDILARAVESRRGALQELLGVVADDAVSEGPTAPRGGATWSEPGPRVPAGRDRAQPRERSEPRASGHRRGGPRTARRTDRSPGRVDRPGRGGRRRRNPSAGRAATPGSHLYPRP